MPKDPSSSQADPRRLSLLQAICLNMSMMVGIGPFLTIPLLVGRMQGSNALWIWAVGAVVAIADGLVWSELAAAFPGSGGTYHFYDSVYGNRWDGRLLKFLFIWQFLFSAPLELASGAIGGMKYVSAIFAEGHLFDPIAKVGFGALGTWSISSGNLASMSVMVTGVLMAYRRVGAAGRMMVMLWLGMIATVAWITITGFMHFDPVRITGSARPWRLDPKGLRDASIGLGLAMYTYLGYYQVCYLADEVDTPSRTIPRSILASVVIVAAMYLAMNTSLLGWMDWDSLATDGGAISGRMGAVYGKWAAYLVTGLIAWTALAGTFAAMVSYARVPYAAARAGHFFGGLAALHPRGGFPHRSLLVVGAAAILACLADLETVISALMASRILIQFVGQIATVAYIRTRPELRDRMSFRMWLYPLPALVALVGWFFIFAASDVLTLAYGLGSMVAGGLVFLVWDRRGRKPATLEV